VTGTAFADGDAGGSGLGEYASALDVAPALTQVVQVADRDRGQPRIAGIAIDGQCPSHEVTCCRSGQGVVQAVGFGQQGDVGFGEAAHKAVLWSAIGFGQLAGTPVPCDQSRQLLPGVACRSLQVAQYQSLVRSPKLAIAKSLEHRFDVTVAFVVLSASLKFDLRSRRQKSP